jgi:predicted transcriptional regulator
MHIQLTGHSEKLVTEELARGGFSSPEEVIEHALELLHSEEEWRNSVHDKIERGYAQFERGEFFTAEESRDDMEKRKAAWLSNHSG